MPSNQILLVEDEDADVVHFQRLCRKHGVDADIIVARDGDAALENLRHLPKAPPGRFVIVTDLNMPGLTGHELIEEIRGETTTQTAVVFVVSTSDLPEDISRAYSQNVAGYIVKDARGERLEAGIKMLRHYFEAVVLP